MLLSFLVRLLFYSEDDIKGKDIAIKKYDPSKLDPYDYDTYMPEGSKHAGVRIATDKHRSVVRLLTEVEGRTRYLQWRPLC